MAKSTSAPVPVAKSVLVDTGFLITVFDDKRPNHATALAFYQFFIEHGFAMYLSSIVVSEFCVRNELNVLPMSNFLPLSFDLVDGALAGKIDFTSFKRPGDDRVNIKDDVKLVAQLVKNGIAYFATEDGPLVTKLKEKFTTINPILANEEVTAHFAVHRTTAGVVIGRAVLPGQLGLF